MFSVCPPWENIVAETKFASHNGKHDKTLTGYNVSATMFPSLPRAQILIMHSKSAVILNYYSIDNAIGQHHGRRNLLVI